jgi:hypothetical protein
MGEPHKFVRPAFQNQWKNITTIWKNEAAVTFGIERVFRLFLAASAYIFPGLYIRHVSGLRGLLCRKLAIEIYVVVKLVMPLLILPTFLVDSRLVQFVVAYLGVETLLYVLGLLFLSDIYKPPISNKRSYLMLVMNYVELCFDFAVLYLGLGVVHGLTTPVDSAYFSFVTAFTVGYGDMYPNCDTGKVLVMIQCVCSLVLITLVFTKVVAEFERNNAPKSGQETDGSK